MGYGINRRDVGRMVAAVLISGALLRLILAVYCTNTYDVYWYRIWVLDMENGLFDIYSRAEAISLDYPPLFLILMYPISLLYKIVPADTYQMVDMLFMKLLPVLFDVLCAALIYVFCRKKGQDLMGFFAASLWLCNPSLLFNSTIWGQTDSIMAFLLLISFMLLNQRRTVISTVVFAASCMIKFQCLFFAPIFFFGLLNQCQLINENVKTPLRTGIKQFLLSIGAAVLTVAAVFIPFCIGAKDPLLLFNVYFGSAGKYPHCTLNAFTFYGIFDLNWVDHSKIFFLGLSYNTFGLIMVCLGILAVMCLWFFGKRRCVWMAGFLLMQHIFMFMTSMHERYQIIVLPFILMAYILHRNRRFLYLFLALSGITAINQAMVLANATSSVALPWSGCFPVVMAVFSLINLGIYFWSMAEGCYFFLKRKQTKNDILTEV